MSAIETEIRRGRESKCSKLKRYITVEPVTLAINVPYCLLVICLQNLTLEKACRVNLGYTDLVCDNMMNKAMNNINCGDVFQLQQSLLKNNFTNFDGSDGTVRSNDDHDFNMDVCSAELESQKLGSTINAYTAPFVAVIGVLIVLFWGNWSDKSGKRKPCILVPLIFEFLGQLVALIAAIFMKQLTMEFNAILGAIIRAIGGGWSLMGIGLFSYLTEVTEEKDRVFRFGVMYQLYPIVTICTLPFSGIFYQYFGYIKLISLCMLINFLGVLYIIFILEEVKPSAVKSNIENQSPETELTDMLTESQSCKNATAAIESAAIESPAITESNKCRNAIKDCAMVIVRKRSGNGRKIVCMALAIAGLLQVLEHESENEYYFVRTKLNWEALEEAPYAAYGSVTSFIGNILMLVVMSKYLKMSDTILAIISSSFTALSKLICITVTTTFMLYVAKTFDIFYGIPSLTVRSIVSTVVDNTEIGKIYSMMGVLENISQFIFVPIYTNIYKYTVDFFPNAYFICSFVVITFVSILCWIMHYWVRTHAGTDELTATESMCNKKLNTDVRLQNESDSDE
ncbi:Proton-coupled folate transporter [Pseudolycoriella hygida]|uniref:Proton-coupled folate transporter n=1 Tax=Pseudolycoriella hygida TaxID=35572 RepID=A0A9Q0S4Q5_9DIPT|nr:Proton-coupled folate transporter [Pseudolycoriella hygida]